MRKGKNLNQLGKGHPTGYENYRIRLLQFPFLTLIVERNQQNDTLQQSYDSLVNLLRVFFKNYLGPR